MNPLTISPAPAAAMTAVASMGMMVSISSVVIAGLPTAALSLNVRAMVIASLVI
jgi:hypothetical protein